MASFPNLVAWESDPNDTLEKLAAVGALLKYFDHNTAVKYSIKLDMLAPGLMANNSLIGMRTVLASAIADLTLAVDPIKSQIYGPGATYDFYRDFRRLLSTGKTRVFFVDPYVNDEFFNLYLEHLASHVECRILFNAAKSSKNIPMLSKWGQCNFSVS